MYNIALFLKYSGCFFFGWQATIHGPSIEEEIQKALKCILNKNYILQAASRTDRGVNALFQVVNFYEEKHINLLKLKKALNAILPKDIRIFDAKFMQKDFHPSLDSKKKKYVYYIYNASLLDPHKRDFSWHFFYPIDLNKLKKTKTKLIGTFDFSGFSNKSPITSSNRKPNQSDNIRTIFDIEIQRKKELIEIAITGDRFLYKMVRNIVATLAYIGANKLSENILEQILIKKDRKLIPMTAPANGLFLKKIYY